MRRIVVVGASLAGLRAVEALRGRGFEGTVTLVGAEPRRPYNRPPLSKQVLAGDLPHDALDLRAEGFDDLQVDLRLGVAATALDLRSQRVELAHDAPLDFDGLIVATGAAARNLPGAEQFSNVRTLRTIDDALVIRRAFERRSRVVVVGAGFIGCEVAATARMCGLEVTLVELMELPLVATLGREIGAALAALHRDHGVDLRLGVGVAALEGARDTVERVRLTDGTSVEADLVVVGIGAAPATAWLESSGLTLRNGLVCDAMCAAVPGVVYGAGDVARWYNPVFDEEMRVEHWSNAVEQGAAAAENLLLGPDSSIPFASVPDFWSDQYDVKVTFVGHSRPGDELHVVQGSIAERRFVALYRRGDRLVGGICFGRPRLLSPFQEAIRRRAGWSDELAEAGVR